MGGSFPTVSLCLAATLDGKIASARGGTPDFTSRYDRHKLFRLRAEADMLLIGANTVRQEQLLPMVRDADCRARRLEAGLREHPPFTIVSGSQDLPWHSPFFSKRQQDCYLLSGPVKASLQPVLKDLKIKHIPLGPRCDLNRGLARLGQLGFRNILAEGGGLLTHALLEANCVSTLHLTLAPTLFAGTETPSLCQGPRFEVPPRFELEECSVRESELHLVYRINSGG